MSVFGHTHPKSFNKLLVFLNLLQHAKNQFIPSVHICDKVNFRNPSAVWPHLFLTMPNQNISDQLLIFVNLYQHTKNQLLHLFILQIQSILESATRLVTRIFDHMHPKHFQAPFNLHKFVTACKKTVNSMCSFFNYRQFWSSETRLATPIFDLAQPKKFTINFLISVNLYHHPENEAVSSTCSGEIIDLKILQSDWLRTFWLVSQEQDFLHHRFCTGIQQ